MRIRRVVDLSVPVGADTVVYPAFRPDKTYQLADVTAFNRYVDTLQEASGEDCGTFYGFLNATRHRHDFFHQMGSRVSDHGLTHLPLAPCDDSTAKRIYDDARRGGQPSPLEQQQLTLWMMLHYGELDHQKGWVKQLHLGAMRNNNVWALRHLGPDTGFDSIGDYPQAQGLSLYLGTLAGRSQLPRTILYNLNPADNDVFASMIGNFQSAQAPGWMQFGSGWWFLDQKDGMTRQLVALSNHCLLTRFVGMLTDSRSFMSYPRHEYFRRILCNLIGRDVEDGQLPSDMQFLGGVVEDICFRNARAYFRMKLKGRHDCCDDAIASAS